MIADSHHMIRIRLRLINAREFRKLTQGQVAGMLGVHRPTISNVESGEQRLTVELLLKLCEVYRITAAKVLSEKDDLCPFEDYTHDASKWRCQD